MPRSSSRFDGSSPAWMPRRRSTVCGGVTCARSGARRAAARQAAPTPTPTRPREVWSRGTPTRPREVWSDATSAARTVHPGQHPGIRVHSEGTARACAHGMTAPRQVLEGTTYLVTRRASERRFFLRPAKETTAIFGYLLAVLSERYGILLHAACVLSNHFHLVLTDPDARLPEFHRDLDALVARAVNCALGRWEALWERDSYSAVRLETPDAVLEKMVYVLANPVAAGLVRRGGDWPGLWSDPKLIGGEGVVLRAAEGLLPRKRPLARDRSPAVPPASRLRKHPRARRRAPPPPSTGGGPRRRRPRGEGPLVHGRRPGPRAETGRASRGRRAPPRPQSPRRVQEQVEEDRGAPRARRVPLRVPRRARCLEGRRAQRLLPHGNLADARAPSRLLSRAGLKRLQPFREVQVGPRQGGTGREALPLKFSARRARALHVAPPDARCPPSTASDPPPRGRATAERMSGVAHGASSALTIKRPSEGTGGTEVGDRECAHDQTTLGRGPGGELVWGAGVARRRTERKEPRLRRGSCRPKRRTGHAAPFVERYCAGRGQPLGLAPDGASPRC